MTQTVVQGSTHLHLLELLKYEESHSYPDFLTQHQIWKRPPSEELSLPYSVWWLITHDFHETFFDSLKLSSWITQTPLVSEHETLESSVSLTTLQIHIYILQIMPLCYSLRLCDSTAFLFFFFNVCHIFLWFYFYFFYFLTLQYCIGFAIYQHKSATGIHVFPILNPSSSSLPIPTLWVVAVHQPQASSIVHQTWTGDSFNIWYYTCFSAILPNHPTLSLSHRVQKTILYINVSFAVSYTGLLLPSF